jgi:hypothetical protein
MRLAGLLVRELDTLLGEGEALPRAAAWAEDNRQV